MLGGGKRGKANTCRGKEKEGGHFMFDGGSWFYWNCIKVKVKIHKMSKGRTWSPLHFLNQLFAQNKIEKEGGAYI